MYPNELGRDAGDLCRGRRAVAVAAAGRGRRRRLRRLDHDRWGKRCPERQRERRRRARRDLDRDVCRGRVYGGAARVCVVRRELQRRERVALRVAVVLRVVARRGRARAGQRPDLLPERARQGLRFFRRGRVGPLRVAGRQLVRAQRLARGLCARLARRHGQTDLLVGRARRRAPRALTRRRDGRPARALGRQTQTAPNTQHSLCVCGGVRGGAALARALLLLKGLLLHRAAARRRPRTRRAAEAPVFEREKRKKRAHTLKVERERGETQRSCERAVSILSRERERETRADLSSKGQRLVNLSLSTKARDSAMVF